MTQTVAFIDNLIVQKHIPYVDVACFCDHKPVFRHFSGEGICGKELLNMFSCSKPVTVTAALRLMEQGALKLDDPVARFFPSATHAVYRTENGQLLPIKQAMTVRHLFTMTAGLDYNYTPSAVQQLLEKDPLQANTQQILDGYLRSPLQFSPGEKFRYSLCHDVLAGVVEVVSGMRFSKFVEQEIFVPLEMHDSTFNNHPCRPALKMYKYEVGHILPTEGFMPVTPHYESGGAGLCSTVEDYCKFADALACDGTASNGYQLLKPETVALMRTEQISGLSIQNEFTCVQGGDYSYGLGVRVRTKDTGWGLTPGEFGWDGAAGSYLMIDPNRHISVVMGMHLRGWPKCFRGDHLRIVQSLYNEL